VERQEAIQKLSEIIGQDLRVLADKYGVTVFKAKNVNKGWAGHVLESHLGIPINSSRRPNAGSWELKLASLENQKRLGVRLKETMAVTMINPDKVKGTDFEDSHLLAKLKRGVIGARIWESQQEKRSIFYGVTTFDLLDNPEIYNQIKADYDLVRETIQSQGFSALKSEMGVYIQPRTKGLGHGSISRAFYARKPFLNEFILPRLSQAK